MPRKAVPNVRRAGKQRGPAPRPPGAIPPTRPGSLPHLFEAIALAHPDHDLRGVTMRMVVDAALRERPGVRVEVAQASFYTRVRFGGFLAVGGIFGETRYVVARARPAQMAPPLALPEDGPAEAPRTANAVYVLRALQRAAEARGTWVSTAEVREALAAHGDRLFTDDPNAVLARLRGFAKRRKIGATQLRDPLVRHAARRLTGLRDTHFWWPEGVGEPSTPPGVSSRAESLRELVAHASRAFNRPVAMLDLRLWATVHHDMACAGLVHEPGWTGRLHATVAHDERMGASAEGLATVLPLDPRLSRSGVHLVRGMVSRDDQAMVSLLVALDRYRPAEDLEQVAALRSNTSVARDVLASWAAVRVGASRAAFAAALGLGPDDEAVRPTLEVLERRLSIGCSVYEAILERHGQEASGALPRLVERERARLEALRALLQLLSMSTAPWDGVLVGPETAIPLSSFGPLIASVADAIGDPDAATSNRWLEGVPRLTPGDGESAAGREALVDRLSGSLAIRRLLPSAEVQAEVALATELVGPVIRDLNAIRELRRRLAATDPRSAYLAAVDAIEHACGVTARAQGAG